MGSFGFFLIGISLGMKDENAFITRPQGLPFLTIFQNSLEKPNSGGVILKIIIRYMQAAFEKARDAKKAQNHRQARPEAGI